MKRMLDQKMIDYIAKLQKVIDTNSDGAVSVEDFEVSGDFSVNATKMINLDTENALFPLENNAGKVLLVNSDADGISATDEPVFKSVGVRQAQVQLEFEATNLGGRTFTARYCKALVSAGIMYVIISAEIKNETAETIASGNIQVRIRNIPSYIGSKIVCVNGALVSDETTGNPQICGITLRRGNTFSTIAQQYLFKGAQNGIDMNVQVSSLNAGNSEQVEGRTFILLF